MSRFIHLCRGDGAVVEDYKLVGQFLRILRVERCDEVAEEFVQP